MNDIHVLTAAYPEVATEDRGRLALAERVPGAFTLSTCLRYDVAVCGSDEEVRRVLADLPLDEVPGVRLRSGVEATRYLFRTASGLESAVVGERQIWTQFRKAVADAKAEGDVPGLLLRLLEQAVSSGRKARELLPVRPHDSMAAVAAQVVGHVDRVAVFGSGDMAKAVVGALQGLPSPPEITVAARRPESVRLEGVHVVPFGDARALLAEMPAVVTATSAKTRLVPTPEMAEIVTARTDSLVLVDMAMPPDFRPEATEHLEYVDIDDLARMASRRPRPAEADDAVESAADEAHARYRSHDDAAPVIRDLVTHADAVVDDVVARFGGRTDDPELLRQAVHTAARRLLADPIAYVGGAKPDERSVLADAFGLDA